MIFAIKVSKQGTRTIVAICMIVICTHNGKAIATCWNVLKVGTYVAKTKIIVIYINVPCFLRSKDLYPYI